jgi:DNA-binding protein YbaB
MKMLDMMKQVSELRRIQKEMQRKVMTSTSKDGLIAVEVTCDMAVRSVKFDPKAFDPANQPRLSERLVKTLNEALDAAKKQAAEDMAGLAKGGGLSALLGG